MPNSSTAQEPKKYHITTFDLFDSATGYVVNLLIYFGSKTFDNPSLDKDAGEAVKVFNYLLKSLSTGHHTYYTTRKLIDHLISCKIYYTDTVNTNRKGIPPPIKQITLILA